MKKDLNLNASTNNYYNQEFIPDSENENSYGFEPLQSSNQEDSYDFEPYQAQENQEEEKTSGFMQPIASAVAHAAGEIVALPGNIRDLAYMGGKKAQELRKNLNEKLGLGFDSKFIENDGIKNFEDSIKAPFKFINGYIPNSEQVHKYIDEFSKGYFAPKSELSKMTNDLAQDIVSSALHRNPKSLVQNFIIPAGVNIIKKGAELFGVDPSNAEILKMVSWIGANMAAISDPKQMLANRFAQTRRLTSPGDMIPVTPRDLRFLDQLEQNLTSGGSRPSTTAALKKLQEIRNSMQTGQISSRELLDYYRANNELLSSFGAFNVEGAAKAEHVYRLNQVQQLTRNMLNRYGRNQNPRFLESFRENNLAWAALNQSNNVASAFKKNYTKPFVSEATKGLFANLGGKGIAIATGLTALERMQSFVRRLENPILRQYYGQVLSHSLINNKASIINSVQKLEKVPLIH